MLLTQIKNMNNDSKLFIFDNQQKPRILETTKNSIFLNENRNEFYCEYHNVLTSLENLYLDRDSVDIYIYKIGNEFIMSYINQLNEINFIDMLTRIRCTIDEYHLSLSNYKYFILDKMKTINIFDKMKLELNNLKVHQQLLCKDLYHFFIYNVNDTAFFYILDSNYNKIAIISFHLIKGIYYLQTHFWSNNDDSKNIRMVYYDDIIKILKEEFCLYYKKIFV